MAKNVAASFPFPDFLVLRCPGLSPVCARVCVGLGLGTASLLQLPLPAALPCNGNLGWFPEFSRKIEKKIFFLFCHSFELWSPVPAQPLQQHMYTWIPLHDSWVMLTQNEEPKPSVPIPPPLSPILVDSQEPGVGMQ